MFLGKTQQDAIIAELNCISGTDAIIVDIEENGSESKYIFYTDFDNQQICVKVDENIFVYSQQNLFEYDWNTDNDVDIKHYLTDHFNFTDLSEDEIKDGISGFYGSIEEIKETYKDEWKKITVECIFETNCMSEMGEEREIDSNLLSNALK